MDIVIFGATLIGSFLADALSKENYNVTLIDTNSEELQKFSQIADVSTILNKATNWKVLEEARQGKNPIFLAVSDQDSENLISCTIAKKLGYNLTIALIREIAYLDKSKVDCNLLFSIDHLIEPEVVVAHELFKAILNPGCSAIENFFHGKLQVQIHTIPQDWKYLDKPIESFDFLGKIKIALVKRKTDRAEDIYSNKIFIYPEGKETIQAGDEVTFIGKPDDLTALPSILGREQKKVRSVFIAGGSKYAFHLCHILKDRNIEVKIVEEDLRVCEELAKELGNATILNHDITDLDYMVEENAKKFDVFVACTTSTEKNLLVATLAQEAECKNVVTFVTTKRYHHMLRRLGIASALSERIAISNLILSYIYGEMITSVGSVYQNEVKILECLVGEKSPCNQMLLKEFKKKLPLDASLAFIESDGEVIESDPERALKVGDSVLILTASVSTQKVHALF